MTILQAIEEGRFKAMTEPDKVITAKEVFEKLIEFNGTLTGSFAFGTDHQHSDIDVVCGMDCHQYFMHHSDSFPYYNARRGYSSSGTMVLGNEFNVHFTTRDGVEFNLIVYKNYNEELSEKFKKLNKMVEEKVQQGFTTSKIYTKEQLHRFYEEKAIELDIYLADEGIVYE